MEDLEEIMSKIHECKVDFNDDELYYYLCEEVGHISEIPENNPELFEHTYSSIRDRMIEVYAEALKLYYRNDEDLKMVIDKEKAQLVFKRQRPKR